MIVRANLSENSVAMGLGTLKPESVMRCQVENAAPESGGGDPATKDWEWNSTYWRELGAPWGGAHSSAADVGRFLDAFFHPQFTSDKTFGHSGSTGTLCWADPQSHCVFVVLTTLPSEAINPHLRTIASQLVAQSLG